MDGTSTPSETTTQTPHHPTCVYETHHTRTQSDQGEGISKSGQGSGGGDGGAASGGGGGDGGTDVSSDNSRSRATSGRIMVGRSPGLVSSVSDHRNSYNKK